jgi:hypothetical protein
VLVPARYCRRLGFALLHVPVTARLLTNFPGLDLLEVRQLTPERKSPEPGDSRSQ